MSKFSKYLRGVAAIGIGLAGLVAIAGPSQAAPGDVTTLAGSGLAAFADGTGSAAAFKFPVGVATDSSGNVFVADSGNDRVRKITPGGVVTTLAGSGLAGNSDGTGTAASFTNPVGLAISPGGIIYVADRGSNVIRKITAAGVVTTFAGSGIAGSADGLGTAASFNQLGNLVVDLAGNIYVADNGNFLIRKITPGGLVSTLAGSGISGYVDATGSAASFRSPFGLAVDSLGNVFVADLLVPAIRKVTPAGVVTTYAGTVVSGVADGVGAAASFLNPQGVAFDFAGNLFVVDKGSYSIRKIAPGAIVTTVAGGSGGGTVDGNGVSAQFNAPIAIATDLGGNLYVSENNGNVVRKIETPNAVPASSTTTTVAATTTTTTSGGCVAGATVCSSTTTTSPGGCVTGATVCSSTTTTTSPGCPLSVVCASSTTTTTLPCASTSTTIDAAGVPRCVPATTTTTTTTPSTTTTTGVVVSSSLVFPTIPPVTTPGPTIPVPPAVLTFGAIPTVTATSPLPTLTVAALVEKSSIPQAPVSGPSVEGQVADFTPAYTGSSSTGSVVVAMVMLALGTLLLAGNSMRVAKRKAH